MNQLLVLRILRLGANRKKLSPDDLRSLRRMLAYIDEWRYSPRLRAEFEALARKYDCWDAPKTEKS